ncbi:MAG: cupredoxin domain-containing protein [Nitrososphaerales archaeon]
MKKISHYILFSILFSLILIIGIGNVYASQSRVIDIRASQFKFEPGRIIVNQGDTVTFKVKTSDVTHGFYIDGYNVDKEVRRGDEVTVTIVADKVGKFKIRCSITCGALHPFMIGEFIVEQGGVNYVFLSSAVGIILVGVSTLLFIWRRDYEYQA